MRVARGLLEDSLTIESSAAHRQVLRKANGLDTDDDKRMGLAKTGLGPSRVSNRRMGVDSVKVFTMCSCGMKGRRER